MLVGVAKRPEKIHVRMEATQGHYRSKCAQPQCEAAHTLRACCMSAPLGVTAAISSVGVTDTASESLVRCSCRIAHGSCACGTGVPMCTNKGDSEAGWGESGLIDCVASDVWLCALVGYTGTRCRG